LRAEPATCTLIGRGRPGRSLKIGDPRKFRPAGGFVALQPPQSRPLRLFDNSITSSRLFAWYPITICVIALAVYVFLVVDDGFPAPPGPGGGGEGIFFQIV